MINIWGGIPNQQICPGPGSRYSFIASDSDAVGYRVHWRLTTSAQWTHSRWVADVDAYTLENIVIDNYYFGVSSVGADGGQSPVVFPGPIGRFRYP